MDKDNPNKNFFLNIYKNIIKTDSGYSLQKAYEEDEDGNIRETSGSMTNENNNQLYRDCFRCIHRGNIIACMLATKMDGCTDNNVIPYAWINKCDAYSPVYPLNIIKTKEEMIDFIEKTEHFFGCPEEYEAYFGFKRKWDEETGKILETTREYYDRGGSFKNIPDKFPSVIYFDVVEYDRSIGWKLDWIYIGGNDV